MCTVYGCNISESYYDTESYCVYTPDQYIESDLPVEYYGGGGGGGGSGASIEEVLSQVLAANPGYLLEIPCAQIIKWQAIAQSSAPDEIVDKINALEAGAGWFDDWAIQTLNGATGTIVNMDYFSVNIATMPNNPATGQAFTPAGLLDYFRRNINNFVNGSTFGPYCETPTLCTQETALWESANPEGAIVYIDIPGDDGAVICSDYSSTYWNFMTLEAPGAGNHPVSGTRQFGYEPNGTGGYTFYVRGVDRFDSNIVENSLYMTSIIIDAESPFFGADNLWRSFQDGLSQFVNSNGGSSNSPEPVIYRPDWNKVKDVLEGSRPLSDLGCN